MTSWIARRRKLKFLRADGSQQLMVAKNTRSQYESKKNQRMPVVRMPVASFGICANKYCENHRLEILLDLGNNYCVTCYDRGAGRKGYVDIELRKKRKRGVRIERHTDTSVKKR